MNTHIAQTIYTVLRGAQRVLLVPHQHPDGDALGASTAVAEWLNQINIPYDLFCHTAVPQTLSYLPHLQEIRSSKEIWDTPHDVIVVFDSGDLSYAGVDSYIQKLPVAPCIINIDHHMTNQYYGTYNLVDTAASSTCELIVRLFKTNGIAITEPMATSLLTGITTDTDNFTNAATSPAAIEIASLLTKRGADYNNIKDHVYKNISLNAFQLWGHMFSRLKKHDTLNIIHTYLTQHDLARYGLTDEAIGGMTNFLNSIHEGHAGLIFKETEQGHTKGSFRTTRDDVDVAAMAKHFGGGGHKKAAGFTIEKPIHEAMDIVIAELEKLFPQGICANA